jgi:iron(III) transport system permease protein
MAYISLKGRIRGSVFNEYLNNFPLAFPGIVYGFGLFWLILSIPLLSQFLYGSIWAIIISLLVIRLPYSIRFISNNLVQIGDELEEAARISGASWFKSFRSIIIPLTKGGLLSSFTYIFIESIKEIGALILLISPDTNVFTVYLLQLYSQHAAAINVVAAGSVILVFFIAASLAILRIFERARR